MSLSGTVFLFFTFKISGDSFSSFFSVALSSPSFLVSESLWYLYLITKYKITCKTAKTNPNTLGTIMSISELQIPYISQQAELTNAAIVEKIVIKV